MSFLPWLLENFFTRLLALAEFSSVTPLGSVSMLLLLLSLSLLLLLLLLLLLSSKKLIFCFFLLYGKIKCSYSNFQFRKSSFSFFSVFRLLNHSLHAVPLLQGPCEAA